MDTGFDAVFNIFNISFATRKLIQRDIYYFDIMYQYSNNFPIDIFFANNTTSSFKIFERPIRLTRI